MNANYLSKGSWNVICDRCGQKNKREYCQKEWTGLLVCKKCWDPKHPWLIPIPPVIDGLPVPDARPRPTSVYLTPNNISLSIWGGPYALDNGELVSDILCSGWNEIIGGADTLPFSATNFPLE